MKSNRHARSRSLRTDDSGVAIVVGAVLLVGLLVASLATVNQLYVPKWEEDKEAAHMQEVMSQFAALKAVLDQQASNRTAGTVANPISLGTQSSGFFSLPDVADSLRFKKGTTSVEVESPNLLVLQADGTSTSGSQEEWEGVEENTTVEDVEEIRSFRLRIDCIGVLPSGCANDDGDSITVEVREAGGSFAGDFRVMVKDYPSGYTVNFRVRNADGTVVYDQGESYFNQDEQEPYWVNLLQDDFRFDRVLDSAETPFNVSLVESGLTGEYSLTYVQKTEDGDSVLVGGGGDAIANYTRTFNGGRLMYESSNRHFPDQTLILENGGLILTQSGRSVFRVSPDFSVNLVGNRTDLRLTVPVTTGPESGLSGSRTYTVETTPQITRSLQGQTARYYVNITTEYADVWADMWEEELRGAGLDPAWYDVTVTPTQAQLMLEGSSTEPGYRDITVRFGQGSVKAVVTG